MDRTSDDGVGLSEDGPATLPTVLPRVEKCWGGFGELVVRQGLFAVTEGID